MLSFSVPTLRHSNCAWNYSLVALSDFVQLWFSVAKPTYRSATASLHYHAFALHFCAQPDLTFFLSSSHLFFLAGIFSSSLCSPEPIHKLVLVFNEPSAMTMASAGHDLSAPLPAAPPSKTSLPISRSSGTAYERPERARTSHACEPCRERKYLIITFSIPG